MRSMTGHGRGAVGDVVVEIRTVNHRAFDLKLRGGLDAPLEATLTAQIRAVVERGAVQVGVLGPAAAGAGGVDRVAARVAHADLVALATELGLPAPTLEQVLAFPGVVRHERATALDPAQVGSALAAALVELADMRGREGAALAADLGARLAAITTLVDEIEAAARDVPGRLRQRLEARVTAAAGDLGIALAPERLAQEAALLADRADVTEEVIRLRCHLGQLHDLLHGTGATGRRLDFLIQEVGRELNTIGAKAPSAEIVSRVVQAKTDLEKVREQAQNVE